MIYCHGTVERTLDRITAVHAYGVDAELTAVEKKFEIDRRELLRIWSWEQGDCWDSTNPQSAAFFNQTVQPLIAMRLLSSDKGRSGCDLAIRFEPKGSEIKEKVDAELSSIFGGETAEWIRQAVRKVI